MLRAICVAVLGLAGCGSSGHHSAAETGTAEPAKPTGPYAALEEACTSAHSVLVAYREAIPKLAGSSEEIEAAFAAGKAAGAALHNISHVASEIQEHRDAASSQFGETATIDREAGEEGYRVELARGAPEEVRRSVEGFALRWHQAARNLGIEACSTA
jgi:hypothetical protein